MQRNANETFDAYKARRANSNAAVKRINQKTRSGESKSSRQRYREDRDNSKHAGAYGRNLMQSFAERLATQERLNTHINYLEAAKARKQRLAS